MAYGDKKSRGSNKDVKEVSLQDLLGVVALTQGTELKSSKSTVGGIPFESKPVKLDLTISVRDE